MPDDSIPNFDTVSKAFGEIDKQFKKGDEQAKTRKEAIEVIDRLADALQAACDLVSAHLMNSVLEFHQIQQSSHASLRGYFQRLAIQLSHETLRMLLHEGKVCGELHVLADAFSQPFSAVGRGALSVSDVVRTLFLRCNPMSEALNDLSEGEMNYLRDIGDFLDEVRNTALSAMAISDVEKLRSLGNSVVTMMRSKRVILQEQARNIRKAADACIGKLH